MEVGYFAYGSNLSIFQMMKRVGEWTRSQKAFLSEHKLVFNVKSKRWGGFAANIKKTGNDQDRVYGVVYFLKKEKIDVMTSYEGQNAKLEHLDVTDEENNVINGVAVYFWDKDEPTKEPPEAYKQTILEGLIQHGYSEGTIEKVKRCFSG